MVDLLPRNMLLKGACLVCRAPSDDVFTEGVAFFFASKECCARREGVVNTDKIREVTNRACWVFMGKSYYFVVFAVNVRADRIFVTSWYKSLAFSGAGCSMSPHVILLSFPLSSVAIE
jgi:hypothetical protein